MKTNPTIWTRLQILAVTVFDWLGAFGSVSTWSYRPPSAWEVQETTRRLRVLSRRASAGVRVSPATICCSTDTAHCCLNDELPCCC